MDIEKAKAMLNRLIKDNISLTFQDEIEAIETVLNELEKKECKYVRQDNDWIVYQCSNCKMDWVFEDDEPKDSEFNYCPKCGAKITEVVELEEE